MEAILSDTKYTKIHHINVKLSKIRKLLNNIEIIHKTIMHSMKVVSIIYISTQATNFSHSMNKKKQVRNHKFNTRYTLN